MESYIEDFWYESYLSHTDPVVLALNPFFVLECVPRVMIDTASDCL